MVAVELYVYDLSRGMAKQMSLALTGKQLDGIWHTSIVVYGREIFYGQGILEARPGTTHHGQPVQRLSMGDTEIDETTFNEYLDSLSSLYTAEAYHLMDFNCNNFTADVVGFLTGATTPNWITGLPAEFLATPFGQMLKPQIDSMFRSRSSSEHRVNPRAGPSTPAGPTPPRTPQPNGASSLLNSIASAATTAPSTSYTPAAPASPLTIVTSSANFSSLLSSHNLVVNFTNTPGCPPCRVIKPIYEAIASEYASYASKSPGLRFVEIELGVGEGRDIASRYGVSATPTFTFFRDGKKVDELRGATKRDLEGKVEAFVEECWPRHPHRKAYLPAVEGLPLTPITNSAIPSYQALLTKLQGFLAGRAPEDFAILKEKVVPLLEGKGDISSFGSWVKATLALLETIKPEEAFPLIDLWRIGVLQTTIASHLATSSDFQPAQRIIEIGQTTLATSGVDTPKPFLLTLLRFLTNLASVLSLGNVLLSTDHSSSTIAITVESLLHTDQAVRSSAAGLAVNLANYRHRLARSLAKQAEDVPETEWETELLTALIEAIGREGDEDVAHRLLVAISQVLYLNQGLTGMLEMCDVLEAKQIIKRKTAFWKKREVKKLAEEFTSKIL